MRNNAGIIANLNKTLSFVSCGSTFGVNALYYTSIYFSGKVARLVALLHNPVI